MSDKPLLHHITELVDEEKRLRNDVAAADQNGERIRQIETALDQCWDLLRQRRALREFGSDPAAAHVRDPKTVEGYEG